MKAFDTKLIDSIAYEIDALNNMRFKMNLDLNQKINFITPQEYYKADFKNQDYNANNRIAVIFAEGTIIDGKGEEGQIGKKYIKLLRDLRANKSIKAFVLRVNSGGGSALMSDDILKK